MSASNNIAEDRANGMTACVLRSSTLIFSDFFEGDGSGKRPVRELEYDDPVPIEGLEPVGGQDNRRLSEAFATADLNGDGLLDIVTHLAAGLRHTGPPTPIQILFNDGQGGLVDCTEQLIDGPTPVIQFARDVHIADFNGDLLLDVFFSNHGTEGIEPFPCEMNRLLLSDSSGRLVDRTGTHLPQIADFSHGSSFADVDRDGDLDVFVANLGCASTIGSYLMENDGTGRFSIVAGGKPQTHAFFAYEGPSWSAFVDYDKNGYPDLLAAGTFLRSNDAELTVENVLLLNDGTGGFDESRSLLLPPPIHQCPDSEYLSGAQDIWINDVNHDGWQDIVLFYGACATPIFQLLINDQSGGFNDETALRVPAHETASFGAPVFTVSDLDGNRSPDIIFEQHKPDFSIAPYYFLNDGTGNFVRDDPMRDWYLGSLAIPLDLNRDRVMDQVYTVCHVESELGCLEHRWYKRIIRVR